MYATVVSLILFKTNTQTKSSLYALERAEVTFMADVLNLYLCSLH